MAAAKALSMPKSRDKGRGGKGTGKGKSKSICKGSSVHRRDPIRMISVTCE